jgi:hypothetical protein
MGDDFSDAVKKTLANRVGHECSNPECRARTSGPQDDPSKAVNLGVAAHITAASPGGPRYDSSLSPEERSGHGNGIWLCQNCAKHIDNDPARYTVDVLRKWKTDAEAEAKHRVGKTATSTFRDRGTHHSIETIEALRAVQRQENLDQETILRLRDEGLIKVMDVTHMQSPTVEEYKPRGLTAKGLRVLESGSVKTTAFPASPMPDLKPYDRVRISPIVPRENEQADFMLREDKSDCFVFQKLDSQRYVDIPKSFIEKIHSFGNSKPALVQLSGRLQWVSPKRNFELFPDKPPAGSAGAYGLAKDVDNSYPVRLGVQGKFGREDHLPEILGRGWSVFYDSDGMYLRWGGQVFVVQPY